MHTITPHTGTLWAGQTVGLLGGSFNPAHEGHLHITLLAMKRLKLDAAWWLVSPQNPLKPEKGMAPLDKRLAWAAKLAKHPRIHITDLERQLGTRYTADTLAQIKTHFPRTRFVWIMGTDNLQQIHRWKNWEDIFNTVPVCVLDRPVSRLKSCHALERFRASLVAQEHAARITRARPPAWTILHTPLNAQSSTKIRAEMKKKKR